MLFRSLGELEANLENVDLDGLFIGAGAILISRLPNGFAGVMLGLPDRFRWRSRAARAPTVVPEAVPA